jgi:hypothetical protein
MKALLLLKILQQCNSASLNKDRIVAVHMQALALLLSTLSISKKLLRSLQTKCTKANKTAKTASPLNAHLLLNPYFTRYYNKS